MNIDVAVVESAEVKSVLPDIYFHGCIETTLGTDLVHLHSGVLKNGINPVLIKSTTSSGGEKLSFGLSIIANNQAGQVRGYIIDISDLNAYAQALSKYCMI